MGNDQGKTSKSRSEFMTIENIEEERLKNTFKHVAGGEQQVMLEKLQASLCGSLSEYGPFLLGTMTTATHNTVTQDEFVTWGNGILQLMSLNHQIEFYVKMFTSKQSSSEGMTPAALEDLVSCSCKAAFCIAGFTNVEMTHSPNVKALIKSMFGSEDSISHHDVSAWCTRHCRRMVESLHHYTAAVLRGDKAVTIEDQSARGDYSSKLSGCLLQPFTAWLLSGHLASGYIPSVDPGEAVMAAFMSPLAGVLHPSGWQCLYNSNAQGLGKNRFLHHVLNYKAPTVMLLEFEDHVYAVAADSEWREESKRFGGEDCLLLQVMPTYRQMTAGSNMLWLNLEDRTVPKGLMIGRDSRTTFIEIDEDFSKVKHYGVDFKLQSIEVWGCGGIAAQSAQKEQQQWEQKQAEKEKGRKLKLDDWRNNPDKQLLELGGVTTEHAER